MALSIVIWTIYLWRLVRRSLLRGGILLVATAAFGLIFIAVTWAYKIRQEMSVGCEVHCCIWAFAAGAVCIIAHLVARRTADPSC